jgi:hypothetical protein
MNEADIYGEFLGVSSCAITVNLVTLYITEINLSLSLSLSKFQPKTATHE